MSISKKPIAIKNEPVVRDIKIEEETAVELVPVEESKQEVQPEANTDIDLQNSDNSESEAELKPIEESSTVEDVKPNKPEKYVFPHKPLKDGLNVLRWAGLASKKSATFGLVRIGSNGKPRPHQGVDIAVPNGYRCYAVDDGTVIRTNPEGLGDYGKTILIKLDNRPEYVFYAHLSGIKVKPGQKVKAGDVIGLTGSTGNARTMKTMDTGSHLHFEVRIQKDVGLGLSGRLNPLDFFALDEYDSSLYK
nr:MAG TPA: peptidase [Caudoviricetes sp.]